MGRGTGRTVQVAWPAGHEGAVCVAYSGGLDSTVLLHALHETASAQGRPLTAVHVHHGLSANADAWSAHCIATCARLDVSLEVVRVSVDRAAGTGIEAAAREARYRVFAARPEAYVALAHHRDDQAESVLLQLLRGTGMKGVAAMPALRELDESVTLYRPLLAYTRGDLEAWARERALAWIDDESNADARFDRNFLRHEVMPALDARFPAWREALARFASHAAQAQSLLEALAAADGVRGGHLELDPELDDARRANALRAFLAAHGLRMPTEARLADMARQLYDAREDAAVRVMHDGAAITRYRGEARVEWPEVGLDRIPWRGERHLELGGALGRVEFEDATGEGVDAARALEGDWYVAPRAGGERLRLAATGPSRTLKNLLQEHGVPPGERARLPLLFHDERLVWAPGIGIAAEYACPAGKPGLRPLWRVAGRAPLC